MYERFNVTIGASTTLHGPGFNTSHRNRFGHTKTALHETLPVVDEQAWYATYGSTTALISLVHAFYMRRLWGFGKNPRGRHSRTTQNTMVNYHTVVRRKRLHLLIGAMLNHHPNIQRSTSVIHEGVSESNRVHVPAENHAETQISRTVSGPISRLQQLATLPYFHVLFLHSTEQISFLFGPFRPGKILHGLPGLFYCAHCLWACRALEVLYHGTHYARVLWTLTWTAFALDFALTHMALTILREINFATSAPFVIGASRLISNDGGDNNNRNSTTAASRVEQTLTHRSMGGVTVTTAAVLSLFQDHFDAPIPILPFLSCNGPILEIPVVSWIIALTILFRLSHSTHPVMGVVCGTVSGLLWVSGWTLWLAEPYWCSGTLILCLLLCLLSLKIHGKIYLPCIDFVPWNNRGDWVFGSDANGEISMRINQENDDVSRHTDSSDDERVEESEDDDDIELPTSNRRQQARRRVSRGSIDLVVETSNEDIDAEGDAEQVPLLPVASASMTRRPRRGPGNSPT
jgi:hypothetical protein